MDVTLPVGTVDETLGRVCIRSRTEDEADYRLRQRTSILEQEDLSVGELIEMERLEFLHGCVNALRANQLVVLFSERIPSPSWYIFLKTFAEIVRHTI